MLCRAALFVVDAQQLLESEEERPLHQNQDRRSAEHCDYMKTSIGDLIHEESKTWSAVTATKLHLKMYLISNTHSCYCALQVNIRSSKNDSFVKRKLHIKS